MLCPYCGVDYSFEESCFCQPMLPAEKAPTTTPKVKGPWGETAAVWSLEPGRNERASNQTSRAR